MNTDKFDQMLNETLVNSTTAEEYVIRKNLAKKRILSEIKSPGPIWFFKVRYMLPSVLLLLTVGLMLTSRLNLFNNSPPGSYSDENSDTLLSQLTDSADMNAVDDPEIEQNRDAPTNQNQQVEQDSEDEGVLPVSGKTLTSDLLVIDTIAEITTLVSDLDQIQTQDSVIEPELDGLLQYVGIEPNSVAMIFSGMR